MAAAVVLDTRSLSPNLSNTCSRGMVVNTTPTIKRQLQEKVTQTESLQLHKLLYLSFQSAEGHESGYR
jgi:hypothetical protein